MSTKLRGNTTDVKTAKTLAMVEETTIGSQLLFHDIENGLRIQIEVTSDRSTNNNFTERRKKPSIENKRHDG